MAFVTNGSFIDGNAMAGLRACLTDEFTSIYIFYLRGNARTSGEQRRMEKDNVFGMGTRTPVAISILVRGPAKKGTCDLYYRDIGDYLNREEKLGIVSEYGSIMGLHRQNAWQRLKPNEQHDWINLRDPAFGSFIELGSKKGTSELSCFDDFSHGVMTTRDFWCCNFSSKSLANNMRQTIDFFNSQSKAFQKSALSKSVDKAEAAQSFVDTDTRQISWSRELIRQVSKGTKHEYHQDVFRVVAYRPHCRVPLYYDKSFAELLGQTRRLFPEKQFKNIHIAVTGAGASKDFSALISDLIPDRELISKCQCFCHYLHEKDEPRPSELLREESEGELIDGDRRRHAITDGILKEFRSRFSSGLKKMLPRIPLTKETADYQKFTQAGRDLAHWHLNYEIMTAARESRRHIAFFLEKRKSAAGCGAPSGHVSVHRGGGEPV